MGTILPMGFGTPWVLVVGVAVVGLLATLPHRPIRFDDPVVGLGATLFNDPRLSRDGDRSCASCHQPHRGWADGQVRALGKDGHPLARNTPTVTHLEGLSTLFWDGRAESLEAQALVPIAHPREMALPLDQLGPRLAAVPAYQAAFATAFPDRPIDAETVAEALAAFQRTLVNRTSPVDRFEAGAGGALSAAARRGRALFHAVRCTDCHDGPDFTDGSFHDLGVLSDDPGRGAVMPGASLHRAMRVPGLRNVALTAPYFHDGSLPTLEAVVAFYNRGGDRPADPLMRPLGLDERQQADLVEFLRALTAPVDVTLPPPP